MDRVEQQRQELHAVIHMLMQHQAEVLAAGPPSSAEVRTRLLHIGVEAVIRRDI
jgi:hypothetical protein